MACLGVEEVMDKLHIEYIACDVNVEFAEHVFEGFEVVAQFEGAGTLQEGTEGSNVDIPHQGGVYSVGIEGHHNSCAGDEDGHIAVVRQTVEGADIKGTAWVDGRCVEEGGLFEKGRLAVGGSLGGRCCGFANPLCLGGLSETLCLGRVGDGEVGIDALR